MDAGDNRSKKHKEAVVKANSWTPPPPHMGDKAKAQAQPVRALPDMPSPDGDYIKDGWGDMEMGGSDHVENHDPMHVARNGSRDRDPEENPFDTIEAIAYADPQREASDTQMLRAQSSWLHRPSSEGTSDTLNDDYANAVRQMTSDSMERQRNKSKRIGLAR